MYTKIGRKKKKGIWGFIGRLAQRWKRRIKYGGQTEASNPLVPQNDVNLIEADSIIEDDTLSEFLDVTDVHLAQQFNENDGFSITEDLPMDSILETNLRRHVILELSESAEREPFQENPLIESVSPLQSASVLVTPPNSPKISMQGVTRRPQEGRSIARSQTLESFQGSLESIDSLVESYWDPDDDSSHMEKIIPSLLGRQSSEFFNEHVNFLRGKTQPRNVEVVWTSPPKDRRINEPKTAEEK